MVNQWWAGDPAERYFLETTDRPDIGVDLKAPQTADNGNPNHQSYVLIKYVRPGDIVIHFDKNSRQIALWSRVASERFAEDIVWGSHGVIARKAGVKPYLRPGWRVLLEGPFELPTPVTYAELRAAEKDIRSAFAQVKAEHKGSLYLPLEISSKRPLRATQFYLTKAPLGWLNVIPGLASVPALSAITGGSDIVGLVRPEATQSSEELGQPYVRADEEAATSTRDPFSVDPNLVDRGLRGHAITQNALADFIGTTVRTPNPGEPQYDLAWRDGDLLYVAEVKSLTDANEERQLRLGLGQVLRYAHLLASVAVEVRPVLAVERKPSDDSWLKLCEALGVLIVWPPSFDRLCRSDASNDKD